MYKNTALERQMLNTPEVEELLADLHSLPELVVRANRSMLEKILCVNNGWYEVFHDPDGCVNIFWRSHKECHGTMSGTSTIITIDKRCRLVCMKETALSLWITWDKFSYGTENDLKRALQFAARARKEIAECTNISATSNVVNVSPLG